MVAETPWGPCVTGMTARQGSRQQVRCRWIQAVQGVGSAGSSSRKEKQNPKVSARTVGEWISHGSVPDPGFEFHTMGVK